MMIKAACTALSILLAGTAAYAQRSTLIEHDDEWNLFTKLEVSSSDIADESGTFAGVTIGGHINDHFGIGIGGHVLVDSVETESALLSDIESGDSFYAGAYLEYVFSPESLVYLSIDLLLGGGRIEVARGGSDEDADIYIAEPGLNLFVNITETFHFGLGASYRFAGDIDDIPGMEEDAFEGMSTTAFLRFTQF